MGKDIGVVVALPAQLKHRIDAMAAQVGLTTQTLMLAWVLQGMKGQPAPATESLSNLMERTPVAAVYGNEDMWRGAPNADEPASDPSVDVEAMVATRLAEAETAGAVSAPGPAYEAFGPPTPSQSVIRADANVRSIRRPPPQFAPAHQPSHLRSL